MSIDWAKWRRAGAKLSHDGEIAMAAVAAIAASTLHMHELAKFCDEKQPWLLPASLDAAAMVAARMWLRDGTPKWAMRIAAGATVFYAVLSIAANGALLAVRGPDDAPLWLKFGVGAVPGLTGILMVILLALAKRRQPSTATPVDLAAVLASTQSAELFTAARQRIAAEATGDDHQRVTNAKIFCREFKEVGSPSVRDLYGLSDYQAKQAKAAADDALAEAVAP